MKPSRDAETPKKEAPPEAIPHRPGRDPREIENPGDPGPPVLVPSREGDPRTGPDLPPTSKPAPGV